MTHEGGALSYEKEIEGMCEHQRQCMRLLTGFVGTMVLEFGVDHARDCVEVLARHPEFFDALVGMMPSHIDTDSPQYAPLRRPVLKPMPGNDEPRGEDP